MTNRFFSDSSNRRRFMHTSARTLLGVTAMGMLPDRRGLAAEAAIPEETLSPIDKPAKHLIYIYLSGGMSHLDTFDTKPGRDIQGNTQTIDTNVDEIKVGQHLPTLAKMADQLTVVNSLTSTVGDHAQADYLTHTSYKSQSTIIHPGLTAWTLAMKGRVNQTLPGSVFIGENSRNNGGRGFFDHEYEPLWIADPMQGVKHVRPRHMTADQFERRLDVASKLDAAFTDRYDTANVNAYTQMYDDAVKFMNSEDLQAFDLRREDKSVRDRYGNDSFGQGCLLARRLIDHDVRAIEVRFNGWDTHVNNFSINPNLCRTLDKALSALLEDLQRSGKLEETAIAVTTEFGRSPTINSNHGRDHYPKAYSSLLAGGPFQGGLRYGKTDQDGAEVLENPVSIEDFNATIAHAMGLPVTKELFSPTRRPFTVAHEGRPIDALFA